MADHRRVLLLAFSFLLFFALFFTIDRIAERKPAEAVRSAAGDRQVKKYFEGTVQEVTVYYLRGRERGPTLLIIGGIHGDESGGYLTAERYTDLEIQKGTLIVVPRLNPPAIERKRREGLDGDMNRLFSLPDGSKSLRDSKVVNLAKSLIRDADYVLNLHQGDGFYSPRWISRKRNPYKWGQCNVIDAPTFDLPNGEKIELERFARLVAARANARIGDPRYHFLVNNTNTAAKQSRHREQRMSLTYYALSQHNKVALGLEATKNCSLPQAISFLTVVINSVMDEVGISARQFPSESLSSIASGIAARKKG